MIQLPSEQRWKPSKHLTAKENRFIKLRIEDPKRSGTDIAMEVYNAKSRAVAANLASHLLKRPKVQAELSKYSNAAEVNLVTLAEVSTKYAKDGGRDGAAYAAVSERVNNSILDRVHGKATQRIEATSMAVNINVDLSGA